MCPRCLLVILLALLSVIPFLRPLAARFHRCKGRCEHKHEEPAPRPAEQA